jgi:hypothetical protein
VDAHDPDESSLFEVRPVSPTITSKFEPKTRSKAGFLASLGQRDALSGLLCCFGLWAALVDSESLLVSEGFMRILKGSADWRVISPSSCTNSFSRKAWLNSRRSVFGAGSYAAWQSLARSSALVMFCSMASNSMATAASRSWACSSSHVIRSCSSLKRSRGTA